jgi:prepilin-type N-terminal cleavage/methylation domain-containing protein
MGSDIVFMNFPKMQEGLTLIELLITIAVLAIVAAIAVPSITNVVNSADERSLEQQNETVDQFLDRFSEGGTFLYSDSGGTLYGIDVPAQTFVGLIDLDGDGQLSNNEIVAELKLDSKWMPVYSDGDKVNSIAPNNGVYPGSSDITENTFDIIER